MSKHFEKCLASGSADPKVDGRNRCRQMHVMAFFEVKTLHHHSARSILSESLSSINSVAMFILI
jgi:hypothetical protein